MANAFDQFDNPFNRFDATTGDRAQAAASGFNRGALVNLAGLPVATALNAWDLLKMGGGMAAHLAGKLDAGDLPQPTDRSQFAGSPEWIAQKLQDAGAGATINPARPDDETSRLLHAGGQGAAMALAAPQGAAQAASNAAMGTMATTAGQYAAEQGAGPAGQLLAAVAVPGSVNAIASRAQSAGAAATTKAAQRAPINQTIQETQQAGYVYPPSQVNPSLANKIVGGIAGKAATEQSAAIKNQDVTNSLVRQGLGLAEDAPLSMETLTGVRRAAATDYDAIKAFGPIRADGDYVKDLIGLRNDYIKSAGGFTSLRVKQIENTLNDAAKPGFSSESAIELIKRLRSDADTNIRSSDTANVNTGRVQKNVANAIEELVGRNLQAAGQDDLLTNFQQARQRIAKTYSVEEALNPSTGNVDARKLAVELGKGAPLSGELKTAAKAGGFAPLSTREYTQTPPGISVLDTALAGGSAIAGAMSPHPVLGAAAGAAWPFARMAARGMALSGPYQRLMAQPKTEAGVTGQLLANLAPNQSSAALPGMLPALAAEQASDVAKRRALARLLMSAEVQR